MSLIYSSLYLVTNILTPIFSMIYFEIKGQINWGKNEDDLTKKDQRTFQPSKTEVNQFKVHYGKWVMLILSIFVFNLFPQNLLFILLGLVIKAAVIMSPQPLNRAIEEIIQKLHLEIYSEKLKAYLIELYLNIIEKMNIYIVLYKIEEKEEKIEVLNRMKDNVSRIQLELQDNEQIKNKSFIVVVKKLQTLSKKIKSYENIGVNCDILKASDVGKELLKMLEEKTFIKQKQKSIGSNISRIQEPTNDNIQNAKKKTRTQIYPARSQSVKQKTKKVKQEGKMQTSEKKPFLNQEDFEESHLIIKRSLTFDIEEFQFEDSPVSSKRGNNHLSYSPIKTQRNTTKKMDFLQSIAAHQRNVNVATSNFEKNRVKKSCINQDTEDMEKILYNLNEKEKIFKSESKDLDLQQKPQILPVGTYFSSNVQKPIHPFKVNLSSLSKPLVISGQNSKDKILPSPISTSIFSSSKTELKMEESSQEFSIPNKIQASISESEYSDMFESEGQDEEPKLEIKVEAVVQSQTLTKILKPRLDICKIQLYDNKNIKFYSVHDHLIFSGKILKMFKKPENFYEIVCEESKKIQDGKQVQNNDQKEQQVKKVKFLGQAKPFMKYLLQSK